MENETQSAKTSGVPSRKTMAVLIVGALAFSAIMASMGGGEQQCGCLPPDAESAWQTAKPVGLNRAARPRLLDLGATKCIPCKRMAPILDELKEEYVGRMDVEFIDVWQNRDAAGQYGIETIPTQIFFDASGKELSRHQGFIAKNDILKKWQDLGVDLTN